MFSTVCDLSARNQSSCSMSVGARTMRYRPRYKVYVRLGQNSLKFYFSIVTKKYTLVILLVSFSRQQLV